jgi:hypothetical protein
VDVELDSPAALNDQPLACLMLMLILLDISTHAVLGQSFWGSKLINDSLGYKSSASLKT